MLSRLKWFSKCKESKCSELVALLDWCNTPTEGLGSVQLMMESSVGFKKEGKSTKEKVKGN